jgi:hypothetical protein
MAKDEGDVSIFVRQEHLKRIEEIARASGIPVKELIERAIALYLENNKPPEQ